MAMPMNLCGDDAKKAIKEGWYLREGYYTPARLTAIFLSEETKMPAYLSVEGNLNLMGGRFRDLPERLFVGGDLVLTGCSNLNILSVQEIEVGGVVYAADCQTGFVEVLKKKGLKVLASKTV